LIEDEIVYMSYSRTSHIVGDEIGISLGLKLVANGISTNGKMVFELP
jgi:hypothetical protein